MSLRGRYPTKFRRSGNFRGHERPSFKERGRPFKRKYHEDRDSPPLQRFREHVPTRGRGRPVERERDYYSERGRGKPFIKHFSDRGIRSRRTRGRFFRGRQGHFRGNRGGRIDSPKKFNRERSYERYGSPTGDWPEENEFDEDERSFDRRGNASDEWYEGDEYYNSNEDHTPFERGLRSPLTIHRRFDSEEFDQSPERSRSRLRRSPSLERRNFPDEREHSFERLRSPVEILENQGRRDSAELRRPLSIERSGSFTKYRRSHSIHGRERYIDHHRSFSPEERVGREERKRYNRHSFDRSLSPPKTYRTRERSFRGSERERSVDGSSRRSIERQIAYEKERLQKMLEHEKKFHEKRSESSIERFLDDCKRSFENKTKSPPISRSNSFDRRDYLYRRNERSFERSLSPFDQARKFRGLENITIERGRSLERSVSPLRRPESYQGRDEFSPERQRSPSWKERFREMHETNSDSGRQSLSPEHQRRRHLILRNSSPEVSIDRQSALFNKSPIRAYRERPNFVGQRERPFLEEQEGPFLGEPEGPFLEEQERVFLENRPHSREDKSCFHRPNILDTHEGSFEGRSLSANRPIRNSKGRSHFLGVGDGPFSENRSISKDKKEYDNLNHKGHDISPEGGVNIPPKNRRELSPVSESGSLDKKGISKKKISKVNLELSPVSQPGSFERKEFSDYHEPRRDSRIDLSPVSQENQNNKGLSSISHNENVHKNKSNSKSIKDIPCETERPSSADSMQKFLAELEDDDKSNEYHIQEKVPGLENMNDSQFGTSICKEKKEISQKSSFDDCKYESLLNKKYYKPFNENKQQEELFNAYENSFLTQTSDAYNEQLFQGRYEQSSKIQGKSNKPKVDTPTILAQETPIPPLNFNKTSGFNTSNEPPHHQSYGKDCREIPSFLRPGSEYLLNQIPQNPNTLSRSNMKPVIPPFFPNQATRPMYINTLPTVPPMPFQQNTLLPNQRAQVLYPPKEFIEKSFNNQTFSERMNKIFDQKPFNWQNQSTEFQTKSIKNIDDNQFQQNALRNLNHSSFLGQSFQNEHFPSTQSISRTGIQQFDASPEQKYQTQNPQHSKRFSENAQRPNNYLENKDIDQFPSWPGNSGANQDSRNILLDGKSRQKMPVQRNVKEVIVISDDEGHNTNWDNNNEEFVLISDGIVIPTDKVVEQYKHRPPTYDVLGKILKGFVIYFGIQETSELQKDPITVLQESFSSSEGFERLDIEEKIEYKHSSEPKQVCELRWKGLLLSRGEGESREEARQVAGIALINALAKTCYTIQTKYGYYNNGRYPKFMLKHPEKPGYYKMVKRDEIIKSVTETVKKLKAKGFASRGVDATHVNAVISYMDEIFQDQETHCELIFGPASGMEYTLGELQTISRHAANNGLQYRWFHGTKVVKVQGRFLCVSRYFSPQALLRYLLAERGDTVRYRLFPPQGPRIDMLTASNVYSPYMIKAIPPTMGLGQNPYQSKQGLDQSNQPESGRNYTGVDQGPANKGNIHSRQDTNPQFQSSAQNPKPRFQGPSHSFNSDLPNANPQRTEFNESFQGSSQNVSNPFCQEGYKRNDPFQGGRGWKRGKWV